MRLILATLLACLLAAPAFAQVVVDPNKPDAELTEEEAEVRLAEWRARIASLQAELDALESRIDASNEQMEELAQALRDCNEAIYRLLGASEADVNQFRERLGRIENRIRDMQRLSDEQLANRIADIDQLEMDLNALRREKIALLPEFYEKILALARDIRTLRERAANYRGTTWTVGTWAEDRACLWNIAAEEEVYGDPFMWPKIWQANTDQIRDPDLIYPGWVLEIPPPGPKSDEELRAERLYYRQKRAEARRAAAAARAARAAQVEQEEAGSGSN